jgi:hypothetical protein
MTGSRVSSVTQAAVVRVRMTLLMVVLIVLFQSVQAAPGGQMNFQRIPLQFIAALGAPDATSGNNAQDWGVWPVDPGPRGVRLNRFERLQQAAGVAPAGWQFDTTDWWLEENGLIMEQPEFPLLPGQYLVTGDRKVTTVLTVHPVDAQGNVPWELADEATLYDVTHLGCRSARYTPTTDKKVSCTPANAPQDAFRVAAGAEMPPIAGCMKQDYAVLFIVGVAVEE